MPSVLPVHFVWLALWMLASCLDRADRSSEFRAQQESREPVNRFGPCLVMRTRVRFTFIESTDEQDEIHLKRSSSEPPSFRPVHAQTHPSADVARAEPQEPSAPELGEPAAEAGQSLPAHDEMPWPSLGSAGHPHFCYRRCVHFVRGQCSNGAECNFCHMGHPADRTLDKADRQAIRSLSRFDLLETSWGVLQSRIRGRKAVVQPIFEVLAAELEDAREGRPERRRTRTTQHFQRLQWSLRRTTMNFASLLRFVAWRCRPETGDQINALLARIQEDILP